MQSAIYPLVNKFSDVYLSDFIPVWYKYHTAALQKIIQKSQKTYYYQWRKYQKMPRMVLLSMTKKPLSVGIISPTTFPFQSQKSIGFSTLHCTLKKAEGVDSVMKTDKKTGRKLSLISWDPMSKPKKRTQRLFVYNRKQKH